MITRTARAALVAAVALLSVAASGSPARSAAMPATGAGAVNDVSVQGTGAVNSAAYPRLGNYDGFKDPSQAAIFTRYNLVIAWDSLSSNNPQALLALRSAHPAPTILAYDRAAMMDYTNLNRYGTNAIYPGWWLLKVGSTLSANINSTQTSIPVASTAPFHRYDDVMAGSETMHITGINSSSKTLTVQRGFYSTAASHNSGARLATHAYLDQGGPSTPDNHDLNHARSWALNMSSVCPRNAQGLRWVDYLAAWMKTNVMSSHLWDGIFYDNSNDKLYDNSIDVNNDGKGDSGFVNNVNVWQQGMAALFSETRSNFPSAVVLGTGPVFSNYDWANGQEMYATDITDSVKYSAYLANYYYHEMANAAPSINLVDPSTPTGPWNLQLMRYGLATALMSNGVYTYDRGATQNGTPWWFDEYDNGAGSALSTPASATDGQIHVAHSAFFHPGDVVIVEGEMMRVTAVTAGVLTVTRAYNGTAAVSHDAGAVVATPQQVQRGLGYLGQPTSLPRVVASDATNLIANGNFTTGKLAPWTLNLNTPAAASVAVTPPAAPSGTPSAAITVTAVDGADLDVTLQDAAFSLTGGQSYSIGFVARSSMQHYAHLLICSQHTSPGCFVDAELGVRPQWTPYVVHFTMPETASDAHVQFGLGDVPATTWITKVLVVANPRPLEERTFTNGMVLLNSSTVHQTVTLPAGYCHLQGDQNPALNNGAPASAVTVPPQDGEILRRCSGSPPPPPPPGAGSGTYQGSLSATGASDSYSFWPSASGPVTVGACAVSTSDNVAVYLYNSAGAVLGSGATTSYCNWASATVSAGQTYTVKTVATSGGGQYRSSWSVNNSRVIWGISGSIDAKGGNATFGFPTLSTAPIRLITCGPGGARFDLYLQSATGSTLASSTKASNCQALSYTPSARGLFRLQVVSVSGSGSYAGAIGTDGTVGGATSSAGGAPATSSRCRYWRVWDSTKHHYVWVHTGACSTRHSIPWWVVCYLPNAAHTWPPCAAWLRQHGKH